MRISVHRIYTHPKYIKAKEWGKLIAITGAAQVLVQAFGIICGIFIIRLLPTSEYAFYTLANTMLGTMTILSDSGIANGVMAQSGKAWQNKKILGVVLATGLQLRKKFATTAIIISFPILIYLLIRHGASYLMAVLIVVSLLPAFWASLSDSLLEIAPKLHQDIRPLQKNQLIVSIGRLGLTFLMLVVFPFTFIAITANGIPRIYGNFKLKKIAFRFAEPNQLPDAAVKKEVQKSIKRTMPMVIYYCLSGQITIWLLSFFGSTESISNIGALGRFTSIFSLFSIIFSTIIVPRFSRMQNIKSLILSRFVTVQVILIVIVSIMLYLTYVFSDQLLWILGPAYKGLNFELFLSIMIGCLGLLAGCSSGMAISRGWFIKPYYLIAINLISTICAISLFNISSLIGTLYFNILITVVGYLYALAYAFYSIRKLSKD